MPAGAHIGIQAGSQPVDIERIIASVSVGAAKAYQDGLNAQVHGTEMREPDVFMIQRELARHAKITFIGGTNPIVARNWVTDMEFQYRFFELHISI